MTDVFISYSRNDRDKVQFIAEALEREGIGVWWDPEIPPGESFSKVIDRQLKAAKCIIVVWSQSSIHSNWVQEEADDGQMRNLLVPVMIDEVDLPRGFKRLQTADLRNWRGDKNDPNWQLISSQVKKLVSARNADAAAERQAAASQAARPAPARASSPQPASGGGLPILPIAIVLLLLIAGGAGYWFLMGPGAGGKPEQTLAGNTSPSEAEEEQVAAADDAAAPAPEDLEVAVAEEEPAVEVTETAELAEASEQPAAETALSVQPGERFRDCDNCPELIVVAGTQSFTMGAADDEFGREQSELPRVDVTIPAPFAIGVYEVTYDEWRACLADGGCNGYEPPDMGWGEGSRPVINISYADAEAFTEWLSGKTGETYRIPSEAEWEYAARAGGETPFSTGDLISTDEANFNGQYPYKNAPAGRNRAKTVEVGSFKPNAFGLYDVHGNVWEWTADCWRASHAGAPADGSPVGGACSNRVIKGGAWITGAWRLRSSHRRSVGATERKFDMGLRVVRDL